MRIAVFGEDVYAQALEHEEVLRELAELKSSFQEREAREAELVQQVKSLHEKLAVANGARKAAEAEAQPLQGHRLITSPRMAHDGGSLRVASPTVYASLAQLAGAAVGSRVTLPVPRPSSPHATGESAQPSLGAEPTFNGQYCHKCFEQWTVWPTCPGGRWLRAASAGQPAPSLAPVSAAPAAAAPPAIFVARWHPQVSMPLVSQPILMMDRRSPSPFTRLSYQISRNASPARPAVASPPKQAAAGTPQQATMHMTQSQPGDSPISTATVLPVPLSTPALKGQGRVALG
eukprot:g12920.t1